MPTEVVDGDCKSGGIAGPFNPGEPHGRKKKRLTWPIAKRLKLFGITYLVGKISRSNFFFQGPGRLSETGVVATHIFFVSTPKLLGEMIQFDYMGVSKNKGTPKWMVYNGKPY